MVDASAETLEHNRARVGRDDVSYVVTDVFDWRSEQQYDVVFFSFWLSHVPRPRFGTRKTSTDAAWVTAPSGGW